MSPTLIDSIFVYLRNTRYYLILVSAANRYITIREGHLEKLLKRNNIITKIVLFYFRFILLYRYYCMEISKRINFQWFCVICLFLSLYLSAVHLALFGWACILLLLRFEFSFSIIHRFYKSRTSLIPQHFPDSQDPKRRMHRATQQLAEAIQNNPVVSGAIVGAGGFVAWKYMDYKAAVETRETARETTKATIEAEDRRHKETLEAEDRRFDKQMQVEATERQKDREYNLQGVREQIAAEDRRHKESLEIENQKNRETRLSDIDYSSSNQNNTSEGTESSLTVD